MGWFRKKEERVSFKRDEAGRVVDVERRDIAEEKRAKFEALREEKRAKRQARRQEYREAYDDAMHKARVKRARVRGAQSGSMTFTDRLNSIQSMGSYSTRNNYNPFGTMFDTGLGYKKPYKSKKPKSSTKYIIKSGKAYPVAGSKKKSKKKAPRDPFKQYRW
jgi:hypothetical protein